jgi:chromosomal replication initiation ATPase DnaA
MTGTRQLPLDLPVATRYGEEDFLIGACNDAAYRFLDAWPDWPDRFALLTGPAGSGKSHMAAIFAAHGKGVVLDAATLSLDLLPRLAESPVVVVEDADRARPPEDVLFHLMNLARESGASLLFTARAPLPAWELRLADLHSRLRLATNITIEAPDDALLRAVLVKLFADRQLIIDTQLIEYLATRIERSFAACRDIVAVLDREALARGRRPNRALAAELFSRMEESAGD